MAEFVGQWNIMKTENMPEFMDVVETPFLRKQLLKFSTMSSLHIANPTESTWTFTTKIGPLGVERKYDLGVETQVENFNGIMINSTLTLETPTKFIVDYRDPKYQMQTIRQLAGDEMKDVVTCNGIKAEIHYKRNA